MNTEDSFKLLGTLAIEKGWVTEKQVDDAISQQVDSIQKLGEILIENGVLSNNQLNELLEIHTQKEFQEDEMQFGRIAIKNKFVSKEDIDISLRKQKGTNKLLGEVLIENGLLTLQKCNAILNSQKRFLLNIESNIINSFIACPKCKTTFKIKDPDRPRDVRCSKCGMIFEMNVDSSSGVKIEKASKKTENTKVEAGYITAGLTVQENILNNPNHNNPSVDSDFGKLNTFLRENEIKPDDYMDSKGRTRYLSDARYDIGKEIDRGGMGLILATKDLNIKRDIVTKILLNKYSKAKVLRFIREAQINGQLEHPNIVPVHDLGMNMNGQIYFTMKWVKGETLRDILRKLDSENSKYVQKYTNQALIEIIKKVCDALAYAHSKNIIHRDLKPENIMVGEFGEVQLMDWGLAKVLGTNERTVEALEESNEVNNEIDPTKTVVGTCIGTPEYMSPEQAMGDLEHMDERTDVYGLGGVLHSCLSLTTPVKGNSFDNVLSKVTSGRLNELPKTTPPELVAIVKKAMALNINERYQSINDLSADLTAYQSGYAVSVKHDSFVETLNKLIKRNKALSIGVGISIIALLTGLGVSTWQWKEAIKQKVLAEKNSSLALENERKLQLEKEVGRKNLEAQIKEQVKQKNELAIAAVKKGREFLSQANATDHKFSTTNAIEKNRDLFNAANSFRQALIHSNEMEDARKGLYETGKKHFELSLWLQSFEQAESNISDINFAGGTKIEIMEFQNTLELAKNEKERKIRERVNFLMVDAKALNRKVIHEAASKELISLKNKLTVELLKEYIDSKDYNCQKLAIDSLAWMEEPSIAINLLPYIKKIGPDDKLASLDIQVAAVLAICILKPNSKKIYDAVRERIWEEPDNTNSLLYAQIKLFYEPYAGIMAEKVLTSLKGVKNSDEWLLQGVKYKEGNEIQKSIECFTKAIELNPNNSMAYNNRGLVKCFIEEYEQAILDLDKAIQINPNDSVYYNNRGSAKMNLNNYAEGIANFSQAIKLNPKNLEAYNNRGLAKKHAGDFMGALEDHNTVIKINPQSTRSYINRGLLKHEMKNYKGALLDYEKANQLSPNTFEVFANRANTKLSLYDYNGAISDYSKAMELKPEVEVNYYNRGIAKELCRDFEGALSDFGKVISLNPKYKHAYFKRGSQKINLRDFVGAIDDFNKSSKQNPGNWEEWYAKAIIFYTLRQDDNFREALTKVKELHSTPVEIENKLFDEAEKSLLQYEGAPLEKKTITTASDFFKRGNYRFKFKRITEAESDFLQVIQLDPAFGDKSAYHKLVNIAFTQKDIKKQLKYYDLWIKASPDNLDVLNDYAWHLVSVEDKDSLNLSLGLEYSLKVAEKTQFKSYPHLDTLAFAYFKNDKFEEAVKYAEIVISLLPENTTPEDRKMFEDKLSQYSEALKNKKQ